MYLQTNFFQEILDKAPAEIIVADPEYRYLYANPSAVTDADLREWMVGKTNEEFCRRAGRSEVIARARRMVFEKVLRTGKMVEWTEAIRDEKGVLQHYMHRVTPVREGDGGGVGGERVIGVIGYAEIR